MLAVIVLGCVLAMSVVAKQSVFTGPYSDLNHPGCARAIGYEELATLRVFGADAAGGEGVACDGKTDVKWGPLPAKVHGNEIVVDFSSKGGPANLHGKYDEKNNAIVWEDGNSWKKIG